MNHMENALNLLLKKEAYAGLFLMEPQSIEETRKNRKIANYYDVITRGEEQVTIQNIGARTKK